jgi:hypothetical protein
MWIERPFTVKTATYAVVVFLVADSQCRYWDWALDAALPEESPIWDNTLGMGGDGVGEPHCVEEGPFAFFKPQYPSPHCLQRNFFPEMHGINYTVVKCDNIVNNAESYDQFRVQLEMGPHRMVHNGIGGEMPTDHSSNGEPFLLVRLRSTHKLTTTVQIPYSGFTMRKSTDYGGDGK